MSLAILVLSILPAVMGFTEGPPVSSPRFPTLCTDMIPVGHNGGVTLAMDPDDPPYNITTSASEYTTRSSLTVTITGINSTEFVGFFIQARRADPALDNDVAIGTFSDPPVNTQLLECHGRTNSAWAHSDHAHISTVAATWNAPAEDEGPIEFKATIVGKPTRDYFYTDVRSATVSFVAGATGDTPTVPAAGDAGTTSSGPVQTSTSLVLAAGAIMLTAVLAVYFH